MMGFLVALPSEYDFVKVHILSNPEISSFQETFNRILRTETSSSTPPSAQMSNALVGRNIGESIKNNNTEIVVQAVTQERQAPEELFVITSINVDM